MMIEKLSEAAWKADGALLERIWEKNLCRFLLTNPNPMPIRIREAVLFDIAMPFSGDTPIYGEGYTMLSQTAGTIAEPRDVGMFSDRAHYRLPTKPDLFTVYNMLAFLGNAPVLLGFSSCYRFQSEFRFNESRLEIVLDLENIELAPGKKLALEEFYCAEGEPLQDMLAKFADRISAVHSVQGIEYLAGWCSWQSYGPAVTREILFENLQAIRGRIPALEYLQIDDGYEKHMGDWLEFAPHFGERGIFDILDKVRAFGLKPAIWVAPFIAEQSSRLFSEHPEFFKTDEEGKPLLSSRDTFGGWQNGPWYCLDSTHPGALAYLKNVFSTMRREWGIRYFKLDANVWGAFPFGKYHEKNVTRVEAYRRGMQAIREGAGEDAFLLACNAPMWPSIGTVNASRVTCDVFREWAIFKQVAREYCFRIWQNGKLWALDPDAVLLQNRKATVTGMDGRIVETSADSCTDEEYSFVRAFIFAACGMILSGDVVAALSDKNLNILKKLLPPAFGKTVFENMDFEVGICRRKDREYLILLNWDDTEKTLRFSFSQEYGMRDYFSEKEIGRFQKGEMVLPAHSGRVFALYS